MKNLQHKTKQELRSDLEEKKNKLNDLLTKIRSLPPVERRNEDFLISEIKNTETEILELQRNLFVKLLNEEHHKYRDVCKILFEMGQIPEEIVTNDFQLHKVKAKKYPKVLEAKEKLGFYICSCRENKVFEVGVNGKRFCLFPQYQNKDFEILSEMLEYNSILTDTLTFGDYMKAVATMEENAKKVEEFEKSIKESEAKSGINKLFRASAVEQKNSKFYFCEEKNMFYIN